MGWATVTKEIRPEADVIARGLLLASNATNNQHRISSLTSKLLTQNKD